MKQVSCGPDDSEPCISASDETGFHKDLLIVPVGTGRAAQTTGGGISMNDILYLLSVSARINKLRFYFGATQAVLCFPVTIS